MPDAPDEGQAWVLSGELNSDDSRLAHIERSHVLAGILAGILIERRAEEL